MKVSIMRTKFLIPVLFATVSLAGCNAHTDGLMQQAQSTISSISLPDLGLSNVMNADSGVLSTLDISNGLRQALTIGTQNVVGQLGVQNGFNMDPNIRIPLPGSLAKVDSALSAIGLGSMTDDLEMRLNSAAEAATPKAKALFINAISQMSIADAKGILTGPDNAATSYLRQTMGVELGTEMQPLIQSALSQAGAVQAYDQVVGRYASIPFMPDVKADLNDYVVGKALDGIFYYVAQEEAAIRQDPAKRTTELLQKVFAAQ
jgi:hypothetical protein